MGKKQVSLSWQAPSLLEYGKLIFDWNCAWVLNCSANCFLNGNSGSFFYVMWGLGNLLVRVDLGHYMSSILKALERQLLYVICFWGENCHFLMVDVFIVIIMFVCPVSHSTTTKWITSSQDRVWWNFVFCKGPSCISGWCSGASHDVNTVGSAFASKQMEQRFRVIFSLEQKSSFLLVKTFDPALQFPLLSWNKEMPPL